VGEGRDSGRASVTKHVGRVEVGSIKRASIEQAQPKPAAGTSVIAAPPIAVPVFVDDTGGRRRRLRLLVFATAIFVVLAAAAAWASVFVSPVRPAPLNGCVTTAAGCPRR